MKDILKNDFLLLKAKVAGLFKGLNSEDKAGIYTTVTIHLVVVIIMLIWQISSVLSSENTYIFDFSQVEEAERQQQEMEFKEAVSQRLDNLINAVPISSSQIRNIAVNAADDRPLKDDRGTDVEELYKDAERLAAELKSKQADLSGKDEFVDMSETSKSEEKPKNEETKPYVGPSVLSYSLDGRKAVDLPIPAYRCMGGGDVVVNIKVNRAGIVVDAKIDETFSSTDDCLRNFAKRAARLSKFSASTSAPDHQEGEIVYRFIPQ